MSTHSSLQQELTISNQGAIPVHDDFSEVIFFEYGAETGVLQPPWDTVGPHGPGESEGRGSVTVDTAHVRTGTKAVKYWQDDGTTDPKADPDRRIELHEYSSVNQKHYYISWWVYFASTPPDNFVTLGGFQTAFGPSDNKWSWYTSGRFGIHQSSSHRIQFGYGWGMGTGTTNFSEDAEAIEFSEYTEYSMMDYLNQWVHFQIHVKWATDNTGEIQAWFNNNLVAEKTGIKTDPEGYSEWSQNNCVYAYGQPYPVIVIEQYAPGSAGMNGPEITNWVDDIVAATEKVPEDYRVGHS